MPPVRSPAVTAAVVAASLAAAIGFANATAQEPPETRTPPPPPAADDPAPEHQRLWMAAPRRSAVGRQFELVVRRAARNRERRYVAKLCVAAPALGWTCNPLALRDGVRRLEQRLSAEYPGRWLFEIRNGEQRIRRSVNVAPRGGRLKVLATGDSMTQIFDHYLADGLGGRASVRSEAHISTGLSKPSMLDWVAHSRSQAHRVKPDVTVVFIGANDGFPMSTPSGVAPCCGDAWVREYARRAAEMIRAYRRGGVGRVYWLTLPAPRGGSFRTVFGPVNAAIRRAARRTRGARVVPIDRIFTPGFVYRDSMIWRGRSVTVRQGDGVHLNNTGASIAAQKTIARMRANRIL
ncbi:MAG TPA: GDSL-type esterase/lipase family protein [Thermoleophilaceae bacterium]|nr:GDSL-type esterase/lipase family protein [Thermoleophilaceae bacterium]